jgi:tetratricopeptide (TPR) repeat protein
MRSRIPFIQTQRQWRKALFFKNLPDRRRAKADSLILKYLTNFVNREITFAHLHDELTSECLLRLLTRSRAYYYSRKLAKAEKCFQKALNWREENSAEDSPGLATSLNNLANVLADKGSVGRARLLYSRALKKQRAFLGPEHPDVARTLYNMGIMYKCAGDLERALELYRQAHYGSCHWSFMVKLERVLGLRIVGELKSSTADLNAGVSMLRCSESSGSVRIRYRRSRTPL